MKTSLVCVIGNYPQILTETLYALHQQGKKVDAIHVLTTRDGREDCIGQLFADNDGHYYQYLNEYDIPVESIDFPTRNIIAVTDREGSAIDDIDTERENEAFLQACMKLTFELTALPNERVYFCISGGEKSMGINLSMAAQCYGRSQDRIYHVLVQPVEFQNSRDFYYPPVKPTVIDSHRWDRKKRQKVEVSISTDEADVCLVPMPFFPLRSQLEEPRLQQPEHPASLMTSLIREDRPRLKLDLRDGSVEWRNKGIDVSPSYFALYAYMAEHKKNWDCRQEQCVCCMSCFLTTQEILDQGEKIYEIYLKNRRRKNIDEMSSTGIQNMDDANFRNYRKRLQEKLERSFGRYDVQEIGLIGDGFKPRRFGIRIDRDQIDIQY